MENSPSRSQWLAAVCPKLGATALVRLAAVLLVLPALAILSVVDPEVAKPAWDDGVVDGVDADLFRRAMVQVTDAHLAEPRGKIAFLFLVRGPLPLEEVWQRFFQGHEALFSVYIHASQPGFDCDQEVRYPAFRARQIPSVPISWGGPNLIRAERRLLAAALADPWNQRFVLLSESCLPLFNFSHVYDYLFASPKSFITSHPSAWRYEPGMAPAVNRSQYRKGSQWFALTRRHADMVVADTRVYDAFLQNHAMIPDESYIQTLLLMLEPSAVEPRGVTFLHWQSAFSKHPLTITPAQLTPDFLRSIQRTRLPPKEAIGFLRVPPARLCTLAGRPAHCFLFARKFNASAIPTFLALSDSVGF
ncbi:hypothetical protein CLOM_g2604 [Closterium sp. NIES-68]|nr:hypothetical protein CLOM_g2604 [Closterium sp. NIES-68]GJP78255.1 hypothetical protein CLOP_g8580 [Closterium sp. NIES-67]